MLVLGIETSCDETSASIVSDGFDVLSNIIVSQVDIHKKYSGVVPELASREHLKTINIIISEALKGAGVSFKDIECCAVTSGPGLVGSLIIGVAAAKVISFAQNIPLIEIDHLLAHLYSNFLTGKKPDFPYIGLIVSGGHTMLLVCRGYFEVELAGCTTDDAVGEAYDKVAKLLNLGYPGGPVIDRISKAGNSDAIKFPRGETKPWKKEKFNFSYSGLKTAVAYYLKKNTGYRVEDVAASFQKSAIDVLHEKTINLVNKSGIKNVLLAGGVAANSYLRKKFSETAGINLLLPSLDYCTDNAAMVAGLAYHKFIRNEFADLNLNVHSRSPYIVIK